LPFTKLECGSAQWAYCVKQSHVKDYAHSLKRNVMTVVPRLVRCKLDIFGFVENSEKYLPTMPEI